jgi:hypothetical protein
MRSLVDRNVVVRSVSIVLHSVLCSQNVFDVHAQMLRKASDADIFVLLCLYRSSQYINSRALTDCTDCVTV